MNVSKTLAAAIAATSIVGAVGLAYAQTTTETPASPVNPSPAVISPAQTQQGVAQDPSTQAPAEGSQGTQSGPAPSATDNNSTVTPSPTPMPTPMPTTTPAAPVENDSTMNSEPLPKADRN